MCERSKCVRTVSQTCGNSFAPKTLNACEWQRAAEYSSSSERDAFARAPENASLLRRSNTSSVVMVETPNVELTGAAR